MLDIYLNQIEKIISPKHFNPQDFLKNRDLASPKIQGDYVQVNNHGYEAKSLKSSGSAKSFNIQKRTEKMNKSHQDINTNPLIRSCSKSSIRNCDDLNYLKLLLNEEMKKNMNLRHEIQGLGTKVNELEKKQNEYLKTINILKIEKEMSSKYILKMESLIKNLTNENKAIKKNKIIPIPANTENKLINESLNDEIEKLKNFRQQIYETSKSYDELNINIFSTLKDIQLLFVGMSKDLEENKIDTYDFKTLDKFKSNNFLP